MALQQFLADPDVVAALAATVGIDLPKACVPGVAANLALLAEHAGRLDGFVLPDDPEVAG